MSEQADQHGVCRVLFGAGEQAQLGQARSGEVADVIAVMGLAVPGKARPVIVVCGGADDLADAALERAGAMIPAAVAAAAGAAGAAVVDGGTSAGVMRLAGQARARWRKALPVLVGVAPAGLVTYPGGPAGEGVALEENHSHFILADSSEWGGETRLMMTVAGELAGGGRVVMVLAGGGKVARSEAVEAARRGWPVFVIAGTGGLADDLLGQWAACRVPRRRLAAAALPGKLKYRRPAPASAIGDLDLREIVLEADIRPVTGADPKMFGRELAWELQDEPVLKGAWASFATYDRLAVRLRRMFTRFQAAILVLGVTATLLGLIYGQVKQSWLYWVVVVVPIVVSVLIAVASRRAVGQRWVMLRAAAESVKAAIYHYRATGTATAEVYECPAAHRQQDLASQLEAVERRLMQTEASSGPLTPYRGPLPPQMYGASRYDDGLSPLDAGRYLQIRVGNQRSYFHQRIATLNKRRNLLQLLAVASGAAGAVLAAAKLDAWIGLTAGASAAALAYLGYLQVDNTIVTYNQTASRIAGLERGWRALSPAQQDDAAFRRLVTDCEQALATELSGWVQQMDDAFQDLPHDQATETGRAQRPGQPGPQQPAADDDHATP